ncbi:hypothetical protein GUJ93_ZPchr0220g2935 [Zizania palustris]|uniref:Uncharacterized protein n=1 Tax=Zizania palustris TaxID=103762 RepID=A0A8J5R847_ZIZPA|nr:hypothetical protein GUJ93_ZPchr0220g2935 [Zizania palustris]
MSIASPIEFVHVVTVSSPTTEPSSPAPLNIASHYVAFDTMIDDPTVASPAPVTDDVIATVIIETTVLKDAVGSGESTIVTDTIAASDGTTEAPSATADASHQASLDEGIMHTLPIDVVEGEAEEPC